MKMPKILNLVCLIASTFCLAIGFAWAGQWVAFAAAWIALIVWLSARNGHSTGRPAAALIISTCLGATGLFIGASPILMILSTGFTLASWDLILLDKSLPDIPSTQATILLEKRHYETLALAIGLGLLGAIAGQLVQIQIPFGGMIVLVILALICLERLWRLLSN